MASRARPLPGKTGRAPARRLTSRRQTFCRTRRCERPSTRASAANASTVCAGRRRRSSAWTTSCRGYGRGAIPTATWFRVASNATRRKERSQKTIFSAGSTCFVEEIPAAISQGETIEEAKANLADALKLALQCQRELAEKGLSPQAVREVIEIAEA